MAEEVYQPGENEATVLQMKKAENIRLADILYLIQGTGIDRDRQMTLEQLRDFLQDAFDQISVKGTNSATYIGKGGFELRAPDVESVLGIDGLSFVYGGNSIKLDKDSIEINGNKLSLTDDGIGISGKNSRVEIDGGAVRFFSSFGQMIFDAEGVSIADADGKNRQTIVSKDKDGVFQRVTSESVTSDTISSRIAMIQNLGQASASDILQVNIPTSFNQRASFNNTVSFSNTVGFGQKVTFSQDATFNGKTSCLGLLDARDGLRLPEFIEGSAPTSAEDGTIIAVMNSDGSKHWLAIRSGGTWKPLSWN